MIKGQSEYEWFVVWANNGPTATERSIPSGDCSGNLCLIQSLSIFELPELTLLPEKLAGPVQISWVFHNLVTTASSRKAKKKGKIQSVQILIFEDILPFKTLQQ